MREKSALEVVANPTVQVILVFPGRTGEMEEEYESMCGQLALLDVIVQHGLQEVLSRRKSDPWKVTSYIA